MVEIKEETKRTIAELALAASGSKRTDIKSYKSRRREESKSILKSFKIKHGEKCCACNVNCAVKHQEDPDFWAIKEGKKPKYDIETCPKQGRLERANIKMKRRK